MAIWPFNRRKVDQSLLPDEVTEYYKGGKNTSRGSWLLAATTMLVTAFLAVVLFFGGRWVFQTIFDNNDNETSETEQVSDKPSEVTITEPEKDNETEESTTDSESTQVNENPEPTSNQQDNTPVTGGITEIPNTGPGPNGLQ